MLLEFKKIFVILLLQKKGDFILKVKSNQKDLKDEVKTYFDLGLKRDDVSYWGNKL